MKCMSRSTFGIVIGILNIVGYFILAIASIIFLVQIDALASSNREISFDEDDDLDSLLKKYEDIRNQTELQNSTVSFGKAILIVGIIVCLIMIPISALMIMGIVKKRHTLMAPWLILSAICFVVNCIRTITNPVQPFQAVVSLCLQALIIYPIYTLYRDMRTQSNEQHPDQVVTATGVGYPVQAPHYSAVPAKA